MIDVLQIVVLDIMKVNQLVIVCSVYLVVLIVIINLLAQHVIIINIIMKMVLAIQLNVLLRIVKLVKIKWFIHLKTKYVLIVIQDISQIQTQVFVKLVVLVATNVLMLILVLHVHILMNIIWMTQNQYACKDNVKKTKLLLVATNV